jgi:DNA-binding HxlR family transcriptional regulator
MADEWRESELVIRLLAGRWTLALIAQLAVGGRRYQDLHAALDGISHKVLTDTLRRAERDGLIFRNVDRNRVETATLYQLTDLACSLEAPLTTLAAWAARNWTQVQAARSEWDRRADRLPLSSPVGLALDAIRDISWIGVLLRRHGGTEARDGFGI